MFSRDDNAIIIGTHYAERTEFMHVSTAARVAFESPDFVSVTLSTRILETRHSVSHDYT